MREHCAEVARVKRKAYADCDYWGKPVPNFGDAAARLLIVGLAPGAHGANRTGRMFTGDRSGDFLFEALHRAGFANQPTCVDRTDGLAVIDCVITNAAHCAPPGNKPTAEELANCRGHLEATLDLMRNLRVIVCLGGIAWRETAKLLRDCGLLERLPKFGHGQQVKIPDDLTLIGCYHPSQQNTFTGRVTMAMMVDVFEGARAAMS